MFPKTRFGKCGDETHALRCQTAQHPGIGPGLIVGSGPWAAHKVGSTPQVGRPTRLHWPRAGTEVDFDGGSDNLLRYRSERYAVARIHRHRGRSLPRVLNGLPTEPSPIDALSTVFAQSSCVVIVGARSVLSNTKV